MASGPGKYDDWCTRVRLGTEAIGVVLIVVAGNEGTGFSVQAPPGLNEYLPDWLENMAREIRADNLRERAADA